MIIFIYGTTAEAIKIAPVMRRLAARGAAFEQWVTQQHTEALRRAIPELGLPEPDRVIANGWRGKPLKSPVQMLGWIASVGKWALLNLGKTRRSLPSGSIVVVHGDTMTTVLGTFIGRFLRLPVAHVEAGLRSGNWRHPFPEELDRRIVGRFASIHYAPDDESARNLAGRRNVVITHGNTAKDAVRDAAGAEALDADRYGLVLLHRFEFISNAALVRETLRTLEASSPVSMRLIVDSYSRDAIEATIAELGLVKFVVQAKLEHAAFVALMRGARFIVTDSGGIQQEAAVFGVPTLVHRKVSESREGIGSSAVLSRWDANAVADFLRNFEEYRVVDVDAGESPADIIVEDLSNRGYLG
ncbi:UDP-N-acetylglucosamine 2-epimerase [Microbacterium arborescens]|uniref:UDP-N-acetylglucosamine 2-epimerase n=1 Tax=Microbacterium arborescens TaxID=33883 RepID=UPI0025A01517|nr:UDP-N-acetylglucosamine 2-epimerase [Microbacterium arborescens]WJM15006.1 UDP-N-acetylglucosamine 2-epimerase [Microbacterium arborescens]